MDFGFVVAKIILQRDSFTVNLAEPKPLGRRNFQFDELRTWVNDVSVSSRTIGDFYTRASADSKCSRLTEMMRTIYQLIYSASNMCTRSDYFENLVKLT
ncbi:hypothetical protein NPIL_213051 [Nephila pilipes]|uniref:Uncharacterized protein n=1 Tax=Nephila pilipes TaxID=299642 RepID=A0A8X6JAD8_NEPPI|nr:hypothetical protein NPIL_213051 [Nephila pilipes]